MSHLESIDNQLRTPNIIINYVILLNLIQLPIHAKIKLYVQIKNKDSKKKKKQTEKQTNPCLYKNNYVFRLKLNH